MHTIDQSFSLKDYVSAHAQEPCSQMSCPLVKNFVWCSAHFLPIRMFHPNWMGFCRTLDFNRAPMRRSEHCVFLFKTLVTIVYIFALLELWLFLCVTCQMGRMCVLNVLFIAVLVNNLQEKVHTQNITH